VISSTLPAGCKACSLDGSEPTRFEARVQCPFDNPTDGTDIWVDGKHTQFANSGNGPLQHLTTNGANLELKYRNSTDPFYDHGLCMEAMSSTDPIAQLAKCESGEPKQLFNYNDGGRQQLASVGNTNYCLEAPASVGLTITLAQCVPGKSTQKWVTADGFVPKDPEDDGTLSTLKQFGTENCIAKTGLDYVVLQACNPNNENMQFTYTRKPR